MKINFYTAFRLTIFLLVITGVVPTAYASEKMSHGQTIIEAIRIAGPLDFCGEPVPLDDPDVRERLEREMLISLDNSDDLILWLKRARRYFPVIERVLKENGLPDDLKYITIAESSLKPLAFSHKGASGPWQFIPSTGTRYGLIVGNDIDERRNIYKSTPAWLASEETRKVLISVATQQYSPAYVESSRLTMPGLKFDNLQVGQALWQQNAYYTTCVFKKP